LIEFGTHPRNRAQIFDPVEELWSVPTGDDEQIFGAK
jgi:hypothetical protein